ncbi:hypothetical protein [Actinomadura madurae]|uniref:hypothetical protein n=1 Tax=Actinomadura madurae TaxID=1993 RepID=UPI0020D1FBA1|nr:hypothetical protein [Actinomadura madurae]MCQ0012499.1 hypothetical protein [Actinomadura madurae]
MISAPRRRRSPPWFGAETRRALGSGLAVAGLALAAGWPYWRDHPAAAAITLVSCAAIAVVGVLLATGGRTRRTGLLFTAASVCWAANWAASWDATVGPIMSPYAQANFYLALMIGVLLYPSGRLEYLVDRIWAVLACAILWVCPTALWTTSKPEWAAFRGESVWWPAPFPDFEVFQAVLQVSAALYVFLAFSFAIVLLLRLPRMSRMRRLLALPVTVAIASVGISAALTQKPIMEASIPLDDLLHVYVVQGAVVVLVPLTLLASGLRIRLAELTVAGRMLRLTAPVSVERVRDALRDVLHDPTLELWFWAPMEGTYVDTAGRPVDVDPEDEDPPGPDGDRAGAVTGAAGGAGCAAPPGTRSPSWSSAARCATTARSCRPRSSPAAGRWRPPGCRPASTRGSNRSGPPTGASSAPRPSSANASPATCTTAPSSGCWRSARCSGPWRPSPTTPRSRSTPGPAARS